jgi:hypothetical protein
MQLFKLVSVVDITRSRPSRSETDHLKLGQQANFNSLIQAIGIRSNVEWDRDPECCTGRMPDAIEGAATHWVWEFSVERDFVFRLDDDPVGLLLDDLQGVPVINRLNNSVDIAPSIFQTKGNRANIWIYEISQVG